MLISISHNEYIDNNSSSNTIETLSLTRDNNTFLSDNNCTCHLTTCAKLITDELRGVVCIDHTSMVRIN